MSIKPTTQFSGGQQLEKRLEAIKRRVAERNSVKVGIPAGSGDHDGTPLVVIGAVHEFGSGHIPERSFLRVPLRANQDLWSQILRNGLPAVLRNEITSLQLMDQLGSRAAAASQEAISRGINPPNAPSTIQRKGSSTPLVDTGRLLQSITWEVVEE